MEQHRRAPVARSVLLLLLALPQSIAQSLSSSTNLAATSRRQLAQVLPARTPALRSGASGLDSATPSECEGLSCCDYQCLPGDDCVAAADGTLVPAVWLENGGAASCTEAVARTYDASIPCSRAIKPHGVCGFQTPFACGYGLACVAQAIDYAECLPVCGDDHGRDLLTSGLHHFHRGSIAAGCVLDGQSGVDNTDGADPVSVGAVAVWRGVAHPACTADMNAVDLTLVAAPPPVTNTTVDWTVAAAVPAPANRTATPVNTTSDVAMTPARAPAVAPAPARVPEARNTSVARAAVAPAATPEAAEPPRLAAEPPAAAPLGNTTLLDEPPAASPLVDTAPVDESPAPRLLPPDQAARRELAAQVLGLNMAFFEIQRAGAKPADANTSMPQVWEWKQQAFLSICETFRSELSDSAAAAGDSLTTYPGYFEAGTAVIVTGTAAFTAVQQVLGMLHFGNTMDFPVAPLVAEDPAMCLPPSYSKPADFYLVRQLRYTAYSLAAAVIPGDGVDDFKLIIGVGDESTFNPVPSWEQPSSAQDLCYIADADAPAADIAAQTAAALAMLAKFFEKSPHSTPEDVEVLAPMLEQRARSAYAYAKEMQDRDGNDSVCSESAANKNCVGAACDDDWYSPCELYYNQNPPEQQLFTAAAALFSLTGEAAYRKDADTFWDDEAMVVINNWNNVWGQGVTILAVTGQPDPDDVKKPQGDYRALLGKAVAHWTLCSEGDESSNLCKRTPDGNAYPVVFPWGNTGTSLQGVCMAALYTSLGLEDFDSATARDTRCFIHHELGYLTNHLCTSGESKCNTGADEGFSYIIGLGSYSSHNPHSRDAGGETFSDDSLENPHTLCGGIVSGCYAEAPSDGTDEFLDIKSNYKETEAAVDYSASVICAFGGYAALPPGAFDHCTGRSPFEGRA